MFKPKTNQLTTFGSLLHSGLKLRPDDGGVYRILSENGFIRTKQVTFVENQFPGIYVVANKPTSQQVNNDNDEKY